MLSSKYVKVHVADGSLYVMFNWRLNAAARIISGYGELYDFRRKKVSTGNVKIPLDSVTILETNDKGTNPGVATMVVMGLISVPISLYCFMQPKACFGSCPTFYVQGDRNKSTLVGEGFSSSFCRALQERDVDRINRPAATNVPAEIIVKNEALETHLIRSVNLLVADKQPGEQVFQSVKGNFYRVKQGQPPVRAAHNGQSIQRQLAHSDGEEWFSLADSTDLTEKEDVILDFLNQDADQALIIDKRQSLMTTFLFYHSLSLLGETAASFLAEMDNGNVELKKRIQKLYELLGGIEVHVEVSKNEWVQVATVHEAGPIVSDAHLVRLPKVEGHLVRVRLRMTKGLWRINSINLASIGSRVVPRRLLPIEVFRGTTRDSVTLGKLIHQNEYTVTYPGDELIVRYPGKFEKAKEYFIESEGYYIEWMRAEWLPHQNLEMAGKMFTNPSGYLRKVTPAYKAIEPEMEHVFWNSRYTNPHEK